MRRSNAVGVLAGTALAVGVVTGGWWATSSPLSPQSQAAHCTTFSKYGGKVPCNGNVRVSEGAAQGIGTTFTGCMLGALGGTPISIAGGCLGGAASNIAWGKMFAQ